MHDNTSSVPRGASLSSPLEFSRTRQSPWSTLSVTHTDLRKEVLLPLWVTHLVLLPPLSCNQTFVVVYVFQDSTLVGPGKNHVPCRPSNYFGLLFHRPPVPLTNYSVLSIHSWSSTSQRVLFGPERTPLKEYFWYPSTTLSPLSTAVEPTKT